MKLQCSLFQLDPQLWRCYQEALAKSESNSNITSTTSEFTVTTLHTSQEHTFDYRSESQDKTADNYSTTKKNLFYFRFQPINSHIQVNV